MPVFKYRDPQTGEWINVAGGGGAANIPIQDEPPASGDLWVDTSEEGASGGSVDAYTKEETLSEETKTTLGLGADAVPNQAFSVLKTLIDSNIETITNGVKIATGSYTGKGTYGASNPNSLTFDFVPKIVFISAYYNDRQHFFFAANKNSHAQYIESYKSGTVDGGICAITSFTNVLSWYSEQHAMGQMNASGATYNYIVIG